ncbi:MAG: hypothetical protein LRY55_08915 [Leadbetterella sp.]|nr:hypothetical protein [Leadbetterella sp.]
MYTMTPPTRKVKAELHKKLIALRKKYKDSEELDRRFIQKYRDMGYIKD